MALLSKKTITIDMTSDSIRLLMIKGSRIERWADAPVEPGLIRDGMVMDTVEVGDRIKKLMRDSDIRGKKVIASVSGLYSVSRLITLPPPNGHTTDEMMGEMIPDIAPLPPGDLYTSWEVVGRNGNGHEVLFFGTPANIIDSMAICLKQAGLKMEGLNIKSMALLKLIVKHQALVANIETDCADIILLAGGLPQVTRTIRRGMDTGIDDWVKDIETNIRQTILFFNTRFGGRRLEPDAPLYLTGKLATDCRIADLLSQLLGSPLDVMPVPLQYPASLPPNQFAVNIGLALKQPYTLPVIEYRDKEADDVEQ